MRWPAAVGRLRAKIGSGRAEPVTEPAPAERPPAWEASVRRVHWDPDGVLVLSGWVFRPGVADPPGAALDVVAVERRSGAERPFTVRRERSGEVYVFSTDARADHGESGFEARLAVAALVDDDGEYARTWDIRVAGAGAPRQPFTSRSGFGSASWLVAEDLSGVGSTGPGATALPRWHQEQGLELVVARRALCATRVEERPDGLSVQVEVVGRFRPKTGSLTATGRPPVDVTVRPHGSGYQVDIPATAFPAAGETATTRWYLHLAERGGKTRIVHWTGAGTGGAIRACSLPGVLIAHGPRGPLRFEVTTPQLQLDRLELDGACDPPMLRVSGRSLGSAPPSLELVGARQRVPAEVEPTGPDTFDAAVPLLAVGPWAHRRSALHPGRYELRAGSTAAQVGPSLLRGLDRRLWHPDFGLRVETDSRGTAVVRVVAPRPDDQSGPYRQAQLGAAHRQDDGPLEEAVFLECFDGKSTGDNTGALFAELRQRRPDLRFRWTVADHSVTVPDGGEPLIRHTAEWWQALGRSRYVVTNCWLPGVFRRRPGQRVLQAWHGTPFKTLGLDRPGATDRPGYAGRVATTVGMWSQLIVQNPFSAEVFARAYRFEGQLLPVGYPRNDRLVGPGAGPRRAAVRAQLGLADHERVVLYVPTWREDDRHLFRALDFAELLTRLGPGHRLLVRGHANTLRHDAAVQAEGLIDVTLYPEVADLYLAADVMVTDYSSVMFDWSVTGKPMVFFVPDFERYRSTLRGVYLPLAELAPGPLVTTTAEVAASVAEPDPERHAERYRRWRERFNPWDDGAATARAVDALLAP